MPKLAKELSAIEVKRFTKPGFHAVGGVPGLLLQVTKTGARSWILRATVGSKRRDIGLGSFPAVTLAKAREKAQEFREQIDLGFDPVEERKQRKRDLIFQQMKTIHFKEAAERFIKERKQSEFRNPRQIDQWRNSLAMYAYPLIGDIPVQELELIHVQSVLDPIWHSKTETANRIRSRMENILGWCAIKGFREGQNPAQWAGYLDKIYPSPHKIKTKKNHAALPVEELPDFMKALSKRDGQAARALEFLIQTAARSNEVIGDRRIGRLGVTWGELNLKNALWVIPANRMKSGKKHSVPLSKSLVKMLKKMAKGNDDELLFTGADGGIASNNYLSSVLKRMEVPYTVHGFRSTFKDWCRKYTNYDDEVSELALAHVNSDATRAAYARDELIDRRRLLMEDWARYCSNGSLPESNNVIALKSV